MLLKSEIFQAIAQLGTEIDPVLHDILRNGLRKYLSRHEQSKYNKDGLVNSEKILAATKELEKNRVEQSSLGDMF